MQRDALQRFILARHLGHAPTVAALDALLVEQLHLVRAAGAGEAAANTTRTSDDDVRRLTWPKEWLHQQPVLLSYADAVGAGDIAVTDCDALAAAMTESGSGLPPPAVRDVFYALASYDYVSPLNRCDRAKETPVIEPSSGEVYCLCAAGRICTTDADVTTGQLVTSVVVTTYIVLALVLLGAILPAALGLRHAMRAAAAAASNTL